MKLDVFLPSLLVAPDWFADSAPPRLPALEKLLAHGGENVAAEWPQPLLSAFGAVGSAAAFAAHGDAIDTAVHGWMFAEPAHFQADRDTLNLLPGAQLDVTNEEAARLIGALNENFSDRELVFSRGASGQWYVSCQAEELPQTTSLRSAQRGALFEKLPQSRGKLSWKSIQNEAQMLFHTHPVNAARESAGKLTVNGVWFWGEGVLPRTSPGQATIFGAVFAETPLPTGLGKWNGARTDPLGAFAVDALNPATRHALVIETLLHAHERGDVHSWLEAASGLEQQVFAPLLRSLHSGAIDQLTLNLPRDRDCLVANVNAQSTR
ncbi:MAG: hypothetical protein ABL931_18855, partial [Usitatibacteraceae bacterium]